MKFAPILLTALTLGSTASAYVITIFQDHNCQGRSKRINVWDNTCSTPRFPQARSVRVEKYGGEGQRARFYQGNNCASGVMRGPWDAGQSDHSFYAGNCINYREGEVSKAYGSSLLT